MKKVLAILLAISVLALSACAARQAAPDTQDTPAAETTGQPDASEQAGEELCAKFARAFRRTPFIIASQIDEAFYEVVKVVDVTFIYTDALVPAKDPSEDQDIISVPELRLQLSESNCLGSPAYMASFYKIVRHLKLVRKQK